MNIKTNTMEKNKKLNVITKKQYYIEFNIDTQKYEVIDCTHYQNQPVIKEYKQAAAADRFLNNLRNKQ
jgi:hypothetical protein